MIVFIIYYYGVSFIIILLTIFYVNKNSNLKAVIVLFVCFCKINATLLGDSYNKTVTSPYKSRVVF